MKYTTSHERCGKNDKLLEIIIIIKNKTSTRSKYTTRVLCYVQVFIDPVKGKKRNRSYGIAGKFNP